MPAKSKTPPIPKGVRELSLRPYHGRLFITRNREAYLRGTETLFKDGERDKLDASIEGRFLMGEGHDGLVTYLIWAEKTHLMAHELSHAILETFDRCGIDPRQAQGEPFCYMLSQLMLEAL